MPSLEELAINPDGYEAIGATWQFDLAFYREIGLKLEPLEDPSPNAAMPQLRRAARLMVNGTPKAGDLLKEKHSHVVNLMHHAKDGINFNAVTVDHPAVISWQERNAQREEPDTRNVESFLRRIDWVEVDLIRPRMPKDPSYSEAPFRPVTRPGANNYSSPLEVADQLVQARVAITFDL